MFNRQVFFTAVRSSLFDGSLTQSQVDGINVLLDQYEREPYDLRHFAYELATAFVETAYTMQPIHERGKESYFEKYDAGTAKGKDLGNIHNGDGFKYRGRGFVQLTGRANYAKAGIKLGINFVKEPERTLEPILAAAIMHRGMTEGWFTGRKLSQFFNAETTDWVDARRIVNGTDRASEIGGYGRTFFAALTQAKEDDNPIKIVPPVKPPVLDAVPAEAKEERKSPTWVFYLIIALAAIAAVAFILTRLE